MERRRTRRAKRRQEGMTGGRATVPENWHGRAPSPRSTLAQFFYLTPFERFCLGTSRLSFGDFLGVLSLCLATKLHYLVNNLE